MTISTAPSKKWAEKFIKSLDEFKDYRLIIESFNPGGFDIPGFYLTTAELIEDDICFIFSDGNIIQIPLSDFNDIASDMDNLDYNFLRSLAMLYQSALLYRWDNTISKKLMVISSSKIYELFDSEDGDFLSGLGEILEHMGASQKDIEIITNNLNLFYEKNNEIGRASCRERV